MNTTTKLLSMFVIFAAFLGGCRAAGNVQNQLQNTTKQVVDTAASKNPFTSIKDALSKSLSLNCIFTDDSGRQTKTSIKNGAVRTDFTGAKPEDAGSAILKNKKIYFWNTTKKEGFLLTVPEVSVSPMPGVSTTPTGKSGQTLNAQDMLASLEKFKDSCKPGVVDDSLFVPPTDVKFLDMSQLLQPSGTTSISGGAKVPALTEDQIKQMMQQYAPKDQ